jgi:hypothetical protein
VSGPSTSHPAKDEGAPMEARLYKLDANRLTLNWVACPTSEEVAHCSSDCRGFLLAIA